MTVCRKRSGREHAGAAAMTNAADESIWDLLGEIARLQSSMGQDMIAWARVYESAGEALKRNAETVALMADVGRRGEQFMRNGPSSAARQAMNLFLNPLGALGVNPASGPGGPTGPIARFWEAFAAGMPSAPPPAPSSAKESKETEGGVSS
jgi:hypothetical protein